MSCINLIGSAIFHCWSTWKIVVAAFCSNFVNGKVRWSYYDFNRCDFICRDRAVLFVNGESGGISKSSSVRNNTFLILSKIIPNPNIDGVVSLIVFLGAPFLSDADRDNENHT